MPIDLAEGLYERHSGQCRKERTRRPTGFANTPYTSTLQLPETLQPGYYSLARSVTSSSRNGSAAVGGQVVLKITAP